MRRAEARNGKIWGLAESNIISRMPKMEEKPEIYNRWNSITPQTKFNTSCDARVLAGVRKPPNRNKNTDIFLKSADGKRLLDAQSSVQASHELVAASGQQLVAVGEVLLVEF